MSFDIEGVDLHSGTEAAIAASGLVVESLTTAAVGVRGVVASRKARGWVLVGKSGGGRGRSVLTFATLRG
jgi:hypothetical protein